MTLGHVTQTNMVLSQHVARTRPNRELSSTSASVEKRKRSTASSLALSVGRTDDGTTPSSDTRRRGYLRCLNTAMAIFHAILCIATLSVGRWSLEVPLYLIGYSVNVSFSGNDTDAREWALVPVGGAENAVGLNLTLFTALFFALSATFHTLNATCLNKWYNEGIEKCICPSRWIEYTFSAAVMATLIAYSAGVNLFLLSFAVFVLTATTMSFGFLTEVVARPAPQNTWEDAACNPFIPHALGYIPQVGAWFIILFQFFQVAGLATYRVDPDAESCSPAELANASANASANGCDDTNGCCVKFQMPEFVYAIVFGQVFVFWSFGIIQLVVLARGPKSYFYGEVAYQIMSLFSKGLLGIVLLSNVLILSSFNDIYA